MASSVKTTEGQNVPIFDRFTAADWRSMLPQQALNPIMRRINRSYSAEISQGVTVYPDAPQTFRALAATAPVNLRVVILGQDPYHGAGQADGLAFSVRNQQPPPSLRNILQEITCDLGRDSICRDGNLTPWTEQGILLLNSVLSVRAGLPGSHLHFGWEAFTDEIIRAIDALPQAVVFLLWGETARKKKVLIRNPNRLIIETSHPSPLSAYRSFRGSGQFKRAREFIRNVGGYTINW